MLSRHRLIIKGDTTMLGSGGILYSFHFGVWELMPQTLAKAGFRVGVIVNRYAGGRHNRLGRIIDRIFLRYRSHEGVRVFYRNDVRKIIEFVQNGGVLGMLVDGNALDSKLSKAAKLSTLCRVPLVPFAAVRGRGRGILSIGCDLKTMMKERPMDYLWAYRSRSG